MWKLSNALRRRRPHSAASMASYAVTFIAPACARSTRLYCNDGDWVESCTALVEDMNGRLALWSWHELRAAVCVQTPIEAAA
jgi:hypothetical protein